MAKEEYYPEETLVEKVQSGEYGWKDYVWYHSREWRTEYEKYCRLRDLPMDDDTAWASRMDDLLWPALLK